MELKHMKKPAPTVRTTTIFLVIALVTILLFSSLVSASDNTPSPDPDKNSITKIIDYIYNALGLSSLISPQNNTDLTILNNQSYPQLGGDWIVMFNTTGTADLTITAVNGTEFAKDLTFIELRCGDKTIDYEWIGDSVFVNDYSCGETSSETSKVLTTGKHHLSFRFGNAVEYADNFASGTEKCLPSK